MIILANSNGGSLMVYSRLGGQRVYDNVTENERDAWKDAYYVAFTTHPSFTAGHVYEIMTRHLATMGSAHVAVRVISAVYNRITAHGPGPEPSDLNSVRNHAIDLNLLKM